MSELEDRSGAEQTGVGSYFVANCPPFSVWTAEAISDARGALARPSAPGVPLGLYVYTNKNARQVEEYLDLLVREWEMYLDTPAIGERGVNFVYFGGGTPSFLSTAQLHSLVSRLTARSPWTGAAEITFECEPGTLSESKLAALRDIGVTRLSLGVEKFDDGIPERNGRAHRSPEIFRVFQHARALQFPQVNIDLIAGMVGETEENWRRCIERTLALSPASVTIYHMELPCNTTISGNLLKGSAEMGSIADWATKRRRVGEAFASLEAAGYHVGSAYTAVKDPRQTTFVYRDRLWEGADLVGIGVASFGHINGVHLPDLLIGDLFTDKVDKVWGPMESLYPPGKPRMPAWNEGVPQDAVPEKGNELVLPEGPRS